MRWGAPILAVLAFAVLAGCGGGSGAEIANNGRRPDLAARVTNQRIERQVEKRYSNLGYVHCQPEAGRTARFGNDYWECAIRLKKYGDAGAKLHLVVSGSHVKFGTIECFSDAGESGPDVCRHIHQRGPSPARGADRNVELRNSTT